MGFPLDNSISLTETHSQFQLGLNFISTKTLPSPRSSLTAVDYDDSYAERPIDKGQSRPDRSTLPVRTSIQPHAERQQQQAPQAIRNYRVTPEQHQYRKRFRVII